MTAQPHAPTPPFSYVGAPSRHPVCGQGEMADLIRAFDWSRSPLGSIDTWSGCLLTAVNLMLASPTPTSLYWGPERLLLYNDSFRPFTGHRHPASFAAPGPLVWKESWHLFSKQCEAAFATGLVTTGKDYLVPLERDGTLEDFYWDYSFIPLYDCGEVAGIFNTTQNTTARVMAGRDLALVNATARDRINSQELLVKLLQWQRGTSDSEAMMLAAGEAAGRHLHADRAGFFEIVDDAILRGKACWSAGELPPLTRDAPLDFLGSAFLREARLGLTHVVSDYATDPRTAGGDFASLGVRSSIAVPIIRQSRWHSGFYVHCIQPREWNEEQIAFVREVADQTLEGVELLHAQQAVRESEARLRKILESIGDAVIVVNAGNVITGINPVAERLTGWPSREAQGMPLDEVCVLRADEATLEPHLASTESHARLVQRSGKELVVEHSRTPMRDDAGRPSGSVLIFRDITARESAERRIRQAYKMEALGQLTGGIAHDFNNILAIILGNLELVAEDVGADTGARDRIAQAISSTERAADLTRRLLAYARQQPLNPVALDVVHLVHAAAEFIRRSLGPTIVLEVNVADGLWPAHLDRSQFENALLNLALNARDAMPNGGQIRIDCRNDAIHAGQEIGAEIVPGDYLRIAVTDTGQGMSREARLRATEPFFTTKPVGEGTGLGLSMVYGFLKQSGGHLHIESEPTAGTTVILYLPRAAATETRPAARTRPLPAPLPRGDELVLIVEDELAIRRTVAYLLTSLGYQVLEAEDGPAAMLHLMRTPNIELLLTDVILPNGISGPELALRAAVLQPVMAVIFTSGYSSNVLMRDYGLQEGAHLLNKPFHLAELAKMLRVVLNQRRHIRT